MTAVPAVKGNMGNIEYFQCTMSSKDLVARTQSAKEYFSKDDWDEMGPTGKMQREVSDRYLKTIAPYLLRTKDRFFNSIVVLLDESLCKFVSLDNYTLTVDGKVKRASEFVPFDREDEIKRIGFLELKDKGEMLILDGQHRMRALRAVVSPSEEEKTKLVKVLKDNNEEHLANNDNGVKGDLLSVIFVTLKDRKAQRKLFTDINSYAKTMGQKERLMISEDNGYYKILQNMIDAKDVIHSRYAYFQSVSLPDNAAAVTTGKHLTQIIKAVCAEKGYGKWKDQILPPKSDFEKAQNLCRSFLIEFFSKIDAYKHALNNDPSEIPELRGKDSSKKWGLLFKPMPQVALAEAILYLKEESDMDVNAIYREINKIDWSWKSGSQFEGMVITSDGTILTGSKIQKRLTSMIIYWILGRPKFLKLLGEKELQKLDKDYKNTTKNKTDFPSVVRK
tara:strand:- start:1129 stop:2472 length:1344 start_codon:yes stop_codon:yes gene_type:complete